MRKLYVTVGSREYDNPDFEDGLPYHVMQAGWPEKCAETGGVLFGPYASTSGPVLGADQSARLIGPGSDEGTCLWLVSNHGENLPDHFDVGEYRALLIWSRLPNRKWRYGKYLARAVEAAIKLGFEGGIEFVSLSDYGGAAKKAS